MHQVTKQVRTKVRNKQSATEGAAYTEIKMGILQQRAKQDNRMKIMQRTDKVLVLGLVCKKMVLRVSEMEKTEDERVAAATLGQLQAVLAKNFADSEVEDDGEQIVGHVLSAWGGGVR